MHDRHPEIVYKTHASTGLFYHGFKVFPGEGWQWAYDVTGLIDRDKLSEDRQLRNVDMDSLFRKIVKACPDLPGDFYILILAADPNVIWPADVSMLQHAVYNVIDSSNGDPGGFKLAGLEAAIEQKYGPKVAYTTESDTDSPKHYFARAAGTPSRLLTTPRAFCASPSASWKRTAFCLRSQPDWLRCGRSPAIQRSD